MGNPIRRGPPNEAMLASSNKKTAKSKASESDSGSDLAKTKEDIRLVDLEIKAIKLRQKAKKLVAKEKKKKSANGTASDGKAHKKTETEQGNGESVPPASLITKARHDPALGTIAQDDTEDLAEHGEGTQDLVKAEAAGSDVASSEEDEGSQNAADSEAAGAEEYEGSQGAAGSEVAGSEDDEGSQDLVKAEAADSEAADSEAAGSEEDEGAQDAAGSEAAGSEEDEGSQEHLESRAADSEQNNTEHVDLPANANEDATMRNPSKHLNNAESEQGSGDGVDEMYDDDANVTDDPAQIRNTGSLSPDAEDDEHLADIAEGKCDEEDVASEKEEVLEGYSDPEEVEAQERDADGDDFMHEGDYDAVQDSIKPEDGDGPVQVRKTVKTKHNTPHGSGCFAHVNGLSKKDTSSDTTVVIHTLSKCKRKGCTHKDFASLRPVMRNVGRKILKTEIAGELSHLALFIQLHGIEIPQGNCCDRCQGGEDKKFETCVVFPPFGAGGCASCLFAGHADCRLRNEQMWHTAVDSLLNHKVEHFIPSSWAGGPLNVNTWKLQWNTNCFTSTAALSQVAIALSRALTAVGWRQIALLGVEPHDFPHGKEGLDMLEHVFGERLPARGMVDDKEKSMVTRGNQTPAGATVNAEPKASYRTPDISFPAQATPKTTGASDTVLPKTTLAPAKLNATNQSPSGDVVTPAKRKASTSGAVSQASSKKRKQMRAPIRPRAATPDSPTPAGRYRDKAHKGEDGITIAERATEAPNEESSVLAEDLHQIPAVHGIRKTSAKRDLGPGRGHAREGVAQNWSREDVVSPTKEAVEEIMPSTAESRSDPFDNKGLGSSSKPQKIQYVDKNNRKTHKTPSRHSQQMIQNSNDVPEKDKHDGRGVGEGKVSDVLSSSTTPSGSAPKSNNKNLTESRNKAPVGAGTDSVARDETTEATEQPAEAAGTPPGKIRGKVGDRLRGKVSGKVSGRDAAKVSGKDGERDGEKGGRREKKKNTSGKIKSKDASKTKEEGRSSRKA